MRPFLGHRKETRMLRRHTYIVVLILVLLVAFSSGCTYKQPNTMTIDERLEPYRYFIKDTLLRSDEVGIFVSDGYYNLNEAQRMNFAQNLSWSYYPREIVVRDVRTNYLLMSVNEDRHIKLIWEQGHIERDK